MKEKIFNNFSLKILSVLCAIVLWAVIVNIYDPTTSVTISNVNVELINAQSLTDKDYTYEVVDGSKISVYLSGPKSVITDIKSSDIVATADLSKISAFADYVDIDVKVVKDGKEVTGIEVTPRTTAVKLDIENTKLRKAAGRSKYPLIRRCLNGETRMSTPHASIRQSITYGREPPELKHLSRARKRKKIYRFPK